jgi:organic radical activating enzyme
VFRAAGGLLRRLPNCDTEYRKQEMATPEEIAARADAVTPPNAQKRWVWITGGEPTDHHLAALIAALRDRRFSIALASSGHRAFDLPVDWLLDLAARSGEVGADLRQRSQVVPGIKRLRHRRLPRCASGMSKTNFAIRYVQPLSLGKRRIPESLRACLDFVRANPNWSLSRQDHHYWQVA